MADTKKVSPETIEKSVRKPKDSAERIPSDAAFDDKNNRLNT